MEIGENNKAEINGECFFRLCSGLLRKCERREGLGKMARLHLWHKALLIMEFYHSSSDF